MKKIILILFILLVTLNSVFALDCTGLTESQCKASQIYIKSSIPSTDLSGRTYYSNELITLNGETPLGDLIKAKEKITSDLNYVIDLLIDYKDNLQTEEERGLYGDSHQIFRDYNEIITLIDSKTSFFRNLENQVIQQPRGTELRDLRASARGEWMEVLLMEKYVLLRLQPARTIVGTKCSVDEVLEGNIPYLSEHFNLYPLWDEFKQRAIDNKNIYNSLESGFIQSWLNSSKEWEEVWSNPREYCQDNKNQTNTKTIPSRPLSVAAIKISLQGFRLDNLQRKIETLLTNHPDVDIIVTPEYLYYGGSFFNLDYRDDPVIVDCINNSCSVESIGTIKSDEIKTAVTTMQNIANNNNVNIVFGTLAEREIVDGINYTVNTQLIIDKNGNIIGKHRKYGLVYSNEVDCNPGPSICQQVRNLNLETATIFNLKDKEDHNFKILPQICGEKDKQPYIDQVAGSNAHLIIGSDIDNDFFYENITSTIQGGGDPFNNPQPGSPNWVLKDVYQNKMVNNNAIVQNSYMLVANSFNPSDAGIISWNLNKIEGLEITEDYIYGIINLEISE